MKDSLGDRMKSKYEDVFRQILPQRTFGIVRIDGKAFHTFTKKLAKPYCRELAGALDDAALALCKQMMGCRMAYGQSDEYSFLFTDLAGQDSEMWFAGNIQKIASVAASIFTAHFNRAWQNANPHPEIQSLAVFDARVFIIPSRTEIMNYFVWRQQDASRNSLSMLASCHFNHKQLHGKNAAALHDLLFEKGINWNNESVAFKRGRVIRRTLAERTVSYTHKITKEVKQTVVQTPTWDVDNEIPIFSQDHSYLDLLVPEYA